MLDSLSIPIYGYHRGLAHRGQTGVCHLANVIESKFGGPIYPINPTPPAPREPDEI